MGLGSELQRLGNTADCYRCYELVGEVGEIQALSANTGISSKLADRLQRSRVHAVQNRAETISPQEFLTIISARREGENR